MSGPIKNTNLETAAKVIADLVIGKKKTKANNLFKKDARDMKLWESLAYRNRIGELVREMSR